MKKSLYIYFFLFLFSGTTGLLAQYSLQLSGNIRDALGNPMASQLMQLSGNTFNPTSFISDTTFTDSNGFYFFSLPQPVSSTGSLTIQTSDCPQNGFAVLLDSVVFSVNNAIFTRDFTICDNACQAAFSFQPRGLGVIFSDNSSSPYPILERSWTFGDGDSSSLSSVFHVYAQEGSYPVCLTIRDSSGCSSTFCDTVVVEQCEADFSWENNFALEGSFSSLPSITLSPSYNWDFGDGSQGAGNPINHFYSQEGSYTVRLTLTDSLYNCRDTISKQVDILGDENCTAAFNPIFLGRDSIHFENLSQGSKANSNFLSYQWTFGDQATSQDSSPTHVYQNPGDYLVCLLVEDDFGCRDSVCQIISILPGPTCDPDFVFSPISNLTVAFSALDIIPTHQYNWSLEDGSSYNGAGFFHTFSRPGSYEVCLQVIDSSGECRDSLCQEVILSPEGLCVSEFIWNQLDSSSFAFSQLAGIANPGQTRFSWDFGDGTGSSLANPTHTYTGTGPWEVCLLVEENDCIQEHCYQVSKQSVSPSLFDLKGWVYEDGIPSFDSRVLLYQNLPQQAKIERIGDKKVNFDIYEYNQLGPGSYLIYVEHEGINNYVPTYLGGEIHWQDALASIINKRNVVNPRLDMREGIDIQGLARMEGKIFEGLSQLDGPPLEDEVVLLLADDANRSPISYRRTGADGRYSFGDLPVGSYWVQPEIPGIYAAPRRVVITSIGEEVSGVSFGIGEQFAFPTQTEKVAETQWRLYPNPAHRYVELWVGEGRGKIKIWGLMGQLVVENSIHAQQRLRIDTQDWPEGMYLIEFESGGISQRKKLSVRH